MAEAVIDLLEAVDVEHHQGQRTAVALPLGNGEGCSEGAAVGQPGQRITLGQASQPAVLGPLEAPQAAAEPQHHRHEGHRQGRRQGQQRRLAAQQVEVELAAETAFRSSQSSPTQL